MPEVTAPPLALGLDLGTSAFKAVLLSLQGEVLACGESPVITLAMAPGVAEQDPSQWLAAAGAALAQLAKAADASEPQWRAAADARGPR